MRRRFARTLTACVLVPAVAAALACASRKDESTVNPMSKLGSDRYIQKAIRSSNEGVILLPSSKAERVYELPRLNEIAHGLREPAAECFLRRAIETMEPSQDAAGAPEAKGVPEDERDEPGFVGVPEGQVKIRARIAPSGEVLRTEVLETGFADSHMPACIEKAIARQQFPENQSGVNHHIDIVYWVSLGIQSDVHTDAYRTRLRREQIGAAVRAKPCLQGRTTAGAYHIAALNLVDREGNTMMNRIDAKTLPEPVRTCLARAFRDMRLERQPESFVRPLLAGVDVKVADDGSIAVDGERWLELIELEERARMAEQQAALAGDDGTTVPLAEGAMGNRSSISPASWVRKVGQSSQLPSTRAP
ncbi:MAG: hypothetical protein IAG13_34305, partial [Deltaproteobacteria bacterium]|nr:hypothetical protein [Nannocystaceae bacterium]